MTCTSAPGVARPEGNTATGQVVGWTPNRRRHSPAGRTVCCLSLAILTPHSTSFPCSRPVNFTPSWVERERDVYPSGRHRGDVKVQQRTTVDTVWVQGRPLSFPFPSCSPFCPLLLFPTLQDPQPLSSPSDRDPWPPPSQPCSRLRQEWTTESLRSK